MTEPTRPIFLTLDRCASMNYTRAQYARRIVWQIVQATLYRLPIPTRVGYAWRRTLLRAFGARLGHRAGVHPTTRVVHPWLLEMGDWTMIGPGATVYNLGRITVGDHTVISQNCYLCAGTHDYTKPDLPLLKPEIHIGDGVWIAAGAFIGPGVSVGDNCVVGACSVVVKDVEPAVVVAGNPARVIKPRPMAPPS